MIIITTGCVGTGKTTIAKELSKKLKIEYLDVNKIIIKNKLREKYIKKLDTYEVDTNKLNKALVKIIKNKKNLIIDSHLSHYLPKKYVDYCIVCETELKELKKRLEKRKYNKEKIKENLESQIFDLCLIDSLEKGHNVIEIDTTKKSVSSCVKEIMNGTKQCSLQKV